MTIKKYIKETIDEHENKWKVFFNSEICNAIHDDVINKGIYAFQIIYSFDAFENNVEEIKPLDHKLCVHEKDLNQTQKEMGIMWSYDGGQRYQWSEMETLVFDSSLIRDIKLEKVLNEL
jgi:hypothetical protein